ncbi:hypothetical protein tb265_26700 [Gemmatimonadetes bacterium T265]|nr:hypothetical protein tb265_26700 [Gemmatimonadetes bacterium T265]
MSLLTAAALVCALTTVFVLRHTVRYRRGWMREATARTREQEAHARELAALAPVPSPLVIPSVTFEEFEPRFARNELGPTLASEVRLVGVGDGATGATSDTEAIVLAVCAKDAHRLFEFGTSTGRTTYLWARNSPPDAHVTTLTLAPDQVEAYQIAEGDSEGALRYAAQESAFTCFLYSGTDVESKITQLYGDSKAFDEGPYAGSCDLIFVDGSHAYSYVQSDTEKALRMLRPGGVILWHDYRDPSFEAATIGVVEYLHRLSHSLPLVRLGSTSLVAYRAPADAADPAEEG